MAKRRSAKDAEVGQLDLLRSLYEKGIKLPESELLRLKEAGLIPAAIASEEVEIALHSPKKFLHDSVAADQKVSIVTPQERALRESMVKPFRFVIPEVLEDEMQRCVIHFGYKTNITKKDWMPESLEFHSPEFRRWIDSLSDPEGFFNSAEYHKFNLYVRQAQQWLREFQQDGDDDEEFRYRELERMSENSLFAMDRYLKIKEASDKGITDYTATKAHRVILYLLDCGYSMDIVKARQIAFTTTICGWCLIRAMLSLDFIAKYISENEDKAIRTFQDKVKYPYSRLPAFARAKVNNDSTTVFLFGEKKGKGIIEGNNSVVEVLAPTQTAVASSTPTITLVDEAGQIDVIQDIKSDTIPTMKGYNPKTKRQEVLRQLVIWGTGGYMNSTAGQAFQSVYMGDYEAWTKGDACLIIPLYFNVWYRPGWTEKDQEEDKVRAYSVTGAEAEKARIRFHQSNPVTLDDVFMMGGTKLLSDQSIKESIKRIDEEKRKMESVGNEFYAYGYFEPIFDTSTPAHEGSDVPFKIIGATFVRCDKLDARCSTVMFSPPEKQWINRYYQGTDPIASDSGTSKMASAIWDAHWNTCVCVVNYRTSDYREAFMQVMLMGIYYDTQGKGACPELLEANIGTSYREYKTNKGLLRSLVYETQLPDSLQSSMASVTIGIDNKGLRNRHIVTYMKNIFLTYGHRIWIRLFYEQMEHFVEKIKGTSAAWGPADVRVNQDDTLWALTYSYICSLCYMTRPPKKIEMVSGTRKPDENRLVRNESGELTWKKLKRSYQQRQRDYGD